MTTSQVDRVLKKRLLEAERKLSGVCTRCGAGNKIHATRSIPKGSGKDWCFKSYCPTASTVAEWNERHR